MSDFADNQARVTFERLLAFDEEVSQARIGTEYGLESQGSGEDRTVTFFMAVRLGGLSINPAEVAAEGEVGNFIAQAMLEQLGGTEHVTRLPLPSAEADPTLGRLNNDELVEQMKALAGVSTEEQALLLHLLGDSFGGSPFYERKAPAEQQGRIRETEAEIASRIAKRFGYVRPEQAQAADGGEPGGE